MKKRLEKKEWVGTLLVFLTALISGVAIVVNKAFVTSINPLVFTALRALFIGIIFLFISLYFNKKVKAKKFNKVSWVWLVTIGFIGGGLAFWFFFTGLTLTFASRAAFIHKTLPLYALILAFIFLKEKITRKHLLAIGAMVLGLVAMEFSALSASMAVGDVLVLIATVMWAIENTIAKRVMMKDESNWVVVFSRMTFGALILFAIIALTGIGELLFTLSATQVLYIVVSGIMLFFYVFTYYYGLRYINLSKAATILLVAPVISAILAVVWLGETIGWLQGIGSVLILFGAYHIARMKSEHRGAEHEEIA